MRKAIALTLGAGLVAIGTGVAGAQEWRQGAYPYEKRHHRVCLQKAVRLLRYERMVTADHKLTRGELVVVAALKRDLDRTCGGYRHR